MISKIFAVALLSLALTACESATTGNNANSTAPEKPNTNNQAPAPAASPTPQPSPPARAELKAGDKVKIDGNGSSVDATVVAVDEKAGKVTVRVKGDAKDTTVSLENVTKQ
jgi:transcription antitermination factor NusG